MLRISIVQDELLVYESRAGSLTNFGDEIMGWVFSTVEAMFMVGESKPDFFHGTQYERRN
jgi:hypothetical protein